MKLPMSASSKANQNVFRCRQMSFFSQLHIIGLCLHLRESSQGVSAFLLVSRVTPSNCHSRLLRGWGQEQHAQNSRRVWGLAGRRNVGAPGRSLPFPLPMALWGEVVAFFLCHWKRFWRLRQLSDGATQTCTHRPLKQSGFVSSFYSPSMKLVVIYWKGRSFPVTNVTMDATIHKFKYLFF